MMEQLFEVATEFKFEVGEAILGTNELTDSVKGLDSASQSAFSSLNYFASGLVAHLGLGSGGLLSILGAGIKLSEEFRVTSLGFVNSFSSNMKYLSGDINTFNEKLETSGVLMDNIKDIGAKYGISSNALANMTQKLAPPLAARHKLGENYGGGIEMAKNITISAESMGLNPTVLADSILGAMSGQGLHGKAFARLVNTTAFRESGIKNQQALATMPVDKKIDLLNKALKDLAMDSDSLTYRMNSFDKQIISLRESLSPMLTMIGDAILKPMIMVLKEVNSFLQANGKKIGASISALMGNIFEDPKKLFASIYQMKSIKSDIASAFNLATIIDLFAFIVPMLMKVKFSGAIIAKFMEMKAFLIGYADIGRYFMTVSGGWSAIVSGVKYILSGLASFSLLFVGIFFLMQVFSRAKGIAAANDIEGILRATPEAIDALVKWKKVIELLIFPFQFFVERFAQLISPLMESTFWINVLLPKLSGLADALMTLETPLLWITALANGLFNVTVGRKLGMTKDVGVVDAFKQGWNDVMGKSQINGDPTKSRQNVVYNANGVNITMQFKEQLEPDRIAFSLKEQLYKAMKNQTQAKGSSLQGSFATAPFAGGR